MANLSASMKKKEVSVSIRSSWIAQASRTVIWANESLVGKLKRFLLCRSLECRRIATIMGHIAIRVKATWAQLNCIHNWLSTTFGVVGMDAEGHLPGAWGLYSWEIRAKFKADWLEKSILIGCEVSLLWAIYHSYILYESMERTVAFYLFACNPDKYENTWQKCHVKEALFQVLMHRTDLVYAAARFGGKPCSFLPTPSRKTCSPSERQKISHWNGGMDPEPYSRFQ